MCNTCGQTRCCCDSPTRYNGPDIPDVGIETGTPYDAVIQLLGEFLSDIEFEDGVGISGIAWASNSGGQPQGTQGTTDTYTITLTDNSTYDFVVTNGADGIDGIDGTNGVGISNIAWASNSGGQPQGTQGTTDTYTITLTDASTYNFVVTNGADGADGSDGLQGLASTISRSTQIVNTTVENTLLGTISGNLNVPGGTFVVGDTYMLKARGNINVGVTPANITVRIKINGTTAASLVVPVKTATSKNWDMEVLFTIRTIGATGQLAIGGHFSYGEDSAAKHDTFDIVTVIGSLDTTVANVLDITGQWSVADPTNSIDSELFVLTKLK